MKLFWITLLISSLVSCHNFKEDRQLSFALERAGENRRELEQVLEHYKNDSLKYRAACFLIKNMPGHYSYCGKITNTYNKQIDSIILQTQKEGRYHDTPYLANRIDRISKIHENTSFPIQEDIRIITADFLIQNIEQAFHLWEDAPWSRHLNFDDFCEYLLPYSIGSMDVLEDWRTGMYQQIDSTTLTELNDFSYSSDMQNSAFWACKHINQFLEKKLVPENSVYSIPFIAKTSTRSMISFGTCNQFSLIALAMMRSIGIPVMLDFTPQWPFRSMGHYWNVLLDNTGKNLAFGGCETKTDPDILHKPSQKMAKVYRRTYAINQDLVKLNTTEEVVPDLFRNIFMKDVTSEYMKTCDIMIPTQKKRNHKHAYLAVFDNQKWVPICYGTQKGKVCYFNEIGKDIAYLPLYYDNQGIHPITDPFILDSRGRIKYLHADTSKRKKVILSRKYYLAKHIFDYAKTLTGGHFEASNNPDFSDPDTIHTISHWLLSADSFEIKPQKTYRYWRYVSAKNKGCNLAELAFYSDKEEKELTGTIIGTNASVRYDTMPMDKSKVFDKDILTYYEAPSTVDYPWVGLDFNKPVSINKIIYTPRNDDNNIHAGDLYELFYWEYNHWMSLGQQRAIESKLTYTNVPDNALLLLKDLTKGEEERIFTYENDKQVWW